VPLGRIRLVATAIATAAATAAAQQPAPKGTRARTLAEDLQLFSQVLNQIRVNHPDSLDTHLAMMAAIEGMVRATDPHSFVIPAIRLDSARQRALEDGKLATIPIEFTYANGGAFVVSVAPGSKAATQDIRRGDELLAVDGKRIDAGSSDELRIALAGQKGSSAVLRFERRRHDGSVAAIDRTVKREDGKDEPAIAGARLLDATTGYVRILTFASTKVAEQTDDALRTLERAGMQRLILDLRDNGGGIVEEAANVAGAFLPKGAVVYTSTGRKETLNKTERVSRSFWRRERAYPIVVLVNEGSASASELVAGALQDHDRALIVGRPTFGKALMMQGVPLTDGSLMMLVVGHVKTPCGRMVQRDYKNQRYRDYLRDAGAMIDTTGRPACKTAAGRTVYGGGGIFPDVTLAPREPVPLWMAALEEQELPLRWAATMTDAKLALADVPQLPDTVLAGFRAFARANRAEVATGTDIDRILNRHLQPVLARQLGGDDAYRRAQLMHDPWIAKAMEAFGAAAALKGSASP
jgi:carboxyl-terminal processing protease